MVQEGFQKGGWRICDDGVTVRNVDLAGRLLVFREGAQISLDDLLSIIILE